MTEGVVEEVEPGGFEVEEEAGGSEDAGGFEEAGLTVGQTCSHKGHETVAVVADACASAAVGVPWTLGDGAGWRVAGWGAGAELMWLWWEGAPWT